MQITSDNKLNKEKYINRIAEKNATKKEAAEEVAEVGIVQLRKKRLTTGANKRINFLFNQSLKPPLVQTTAQFISIFLLL